MGMDLARTAAAKRRTPPAPSVRPCVRSAGHGQPRGLHVLALTGQHGNAHAPFGQPQPLPASGPVRRDHLHPCSMPERPQAWSRPMSARSCPAFTMDAHDRTGFRTPPPRHVRPDTVHSTRHAMANRKRRGQGTDERHGRRSDILDRHDHKAARQTRRAPPVEPALRLGNQGRLGDGKTASATVTMAATRQLVGVALPSKPRLGALLSSDDYGSSVERTATLHPLWRGALRAYQASRVPPKCRDVRFMSIGCRAG